ncbi:MAG: APC family permease [Actinobacteria bacterium]|nr:APC family permease [Actinomycetota bacterium]
MTHELKRVMGLPAGIASAVGLVVASSTLVLQGQGFGIAGPGFIIAMLVALLVNLFAMFSFAELSGIVPRAGSVNHYTQAALGPFMAIVAVLASYFIVNIFAGSAEASVPGIIFHDVFWDGMPPRVFSTGIVLILVFTNLRGIKWFSTIQLVTAAAMILSLAAVGIIGLLGLGSGEPVAGAFDTFNHMGWGLGSGIFSLVALAFWLFVGAEFVTPLAEEIKKPRIYIPLSMFLGLLIIGVAGTLYGLASIKYVPADDLAGSLTPHVDAASAMLGRTGEIWLSIASILATITTINTLIAALSRMFYGMAKKGQLPSILARLNKQAVPSYATYMVMLMILVPLLIGVATKERFITFILAATFTWVVGYIIVHVDLIILRWKHPEIRGGFRTPLYPLPQILSLIGLIWMLFKIAPPDSGLAKDIYTIAFVFLGISIVYAAAWVTFKEKKGLFQTTPIAELVEDFDKDEE